MNAQIVSFLLENIVAIIGIMLAVERKKRYGWCIALTFVLYVVYDLSNQLSLNIPKDSLDTIFFVATISILWAIWNIFLDA